MTAAATERSASRPGPTSFIQRQCRRAARMTPTTTSDQMMRCPRISMAPAGFNSGQ
jgi:hypothetical protein